jgi:hypothetical protein
VCNVHGGIASGAIADCCYLIVTQSVEREKGEIALSAHQPNSGEVPFEGAERRQPSARLAAAEPRVICRKLYPVSDFSSPSRSEPVPLPSPQYSPVPPVTVDP